MADQPQSTLKRKRTRTACEPCKDRDRRKRCDGGYPCDSCVKYEYECHYKPQDSRNHHGSPKKARYGESSSSLPDAVLYGSPKKARYGDSSASLPTPKCTRDSSSRGVKSLERVKHGFGESFSSIPASIHQRTPKKARSSASLPAPNHARESAPSSSSGEDGNRESSSSPSASKKADIASGPYLETNTSTTSAKQLPPKAGLQKVPKLHLLAWNIGERPMVSGTERPKRAETLSLERLPSWATIDELALTYFQKVDICYNFLDQAKFFQRWKVRQLVADEKKPFDSILFGVAALGNLFSRREASMAELQLIESARAIIDEHCEDIPSTEILTGQLLRVIYLRMTASPHVAWMASCTLMHMIEAAYLHFTQTSTTDNDTKQAAEDRNEELRWKLYGVAQYFNSTISLDLGRSIVVFQGKVPSILPYLKQQDATKELLSLSPITEVLNPSNQSKSNLQSAFLQVLYSIHTQPPSILAQTKLMLSIYQRLRALHWSLSPELLNGALELMTKALQCVREMLLTNSPWHYTASLPFQIICTLLAIDTRSSLSKLGDAMKVLGEVATAYGTKAMREAYKTARLLVLRYQQRKEDDAKLLGGFMHTDPLPFVDPALYKSNMQDLQELGYSDPWLSELLADMPGL